MKMEMIQIFTILNFIIITALCVVVYNFLGKYRRLKAKHNNYRAELEALLHGSFNLNQKVKNILATYSHGIDTAKKPLTKNEFIVNSSHEDLSEIECELIQAMDKEGFTIEV